jgi:Arc/MetJ-type ribon-helix-helix transcriptional regulator
MKISLTLPEELLNDLDLVCTSQKYERSEFIREAIRNRIYPKGNQPMSSKEIEEKWTPKVLESIERANEIVEQIKKKPVIGWCQVRIQLKVNQPIRLITWEDENGVAVIEKKWACDKCIEHYQNIGRGKVYFL